MVTPTGFEAEKINFYKIANGKNNRKILIKYGLPKNAILFDTVATMKKQSIFRHLSHALQRGFKIAVFSSTATPKTLCVLRLTAICNDYILYTLYRHKIFSVETHCESNLKQGCALSLFATSCFFRLLFFARFYRL